MCICLTEFVRVVNTCACISMCVRLSAMKYEQLYCYSWLYTKVCDSNGVYVCKYILFTAIFLYLVRSPSLFLLNAKHNVAEKVHRNTVFVLFKLILNSGTRALISPIAFFWLEKKSIFFLLVPMHPNEKRGKNSQYSF